MSTVLRSEKKEKKRSRGYFGLSTAVKAFENKGKEGT